MLNVYISEDTRKRLERIEAEKGVPIGELAEAAIAEIAAIRAQEDEG